jgi:hypothetical protein
MFNFLKSLLSSPTKEKEPRILSVCLEIEHVEEGKYSDPLSHEQYSALLSILQTLEWKPFNISPFGFANTVVAFRCSLEKDATNFECASLAEEKIVSIIRDPLLEHGIRILHVKFYMA